MHLLANCHLWLLKSQTQCLFFRWFIANKSKFSCWFWLSLSIQESWSGLLIVNRDGNLCHMGRQGVKVLSGRSEFVSFTVLKSSWKCVICFYVVGVSIMVVVLVMVIIGVGLVVLLVRYQKCIKIKQIQKYVYIFCVKGGHY